MYISPSFLTYMIKIRILNTSTWFHALNEIIYRKNLKDVQFSSAAQSCPTLCNPMDCSPTGLSVHGDSPGKNTGVGCHTLLQGIFSTQRLNPDLLHFRQTLHWATTLPYCGQSIGVSASASVLPMNIQDWFHLEWTAYIFLQSKWLSRVFSSTTVQKHQFFSAQLSL